MIKDSVLNILAGNYENIYIACGKTDLRKGIDGLIAMIQGEFKIDPYSSSMFLFCGGRLDRIKAIAYDREGFTLLYKRLEDGRFKWPRNSSQVMKLTKQQFKWLTEGLSVEQKTALKSGGKRYNF